MPGAEHSPGRPAFPHSGIENEKRYFACRQARRWTSLMCWPSCAALWARGNWDIRARWTLWPPACSLCLSAGPPPLPTASPTTIKSTRQPSAWALPPTPATITGTVLETAPVTAGEGELLAALPQFTGTLSQLPPMYSAVKVNGQPLYKAARAGKNGGARPRAITVYAIDYLGSPAPDEYRLRVSCSKGTTSAPWPRTSAKHWACPPP